MDCKDFSGGISALDFDIVRTTYWALVGNTTIDDALARRHARELIAALTEHTDIDDDLLSRIIRR
ncbi:hypothetical protein [Mesorhizobium sp. CN2-181]|uniref:hypothetical protein n=1 Tax=Mesorhizobium TaxID=68287 RepID=UPI0032B82838